MNGAVSESTTTKAGTTSLALAASWCGSLLPQARDLSGSGWPSAGVRLRSAWPSLCSTPQQHAGFFSRAHGWSFSAPPRAA